MRRRALLQRRGAAIVEFAVVIPIIFLMFCAMIEISRVLMLQHTADTAAYEGARNAMVPGATASEGQAAAQALLSAAGLRNCSVELSPDPIMEQTPIITVVVTVPISSNAWIAPIWIGNGNVVSEVTLVCERPPMIQLTGIPKIKAKKAKLNGALSSLL